MKSTSLAGIVTTLTCLCGGFAQGADLAPAPETSATRPIETAPAKDAREPVIKRTVIEDKSAHIEELRVRGQLQKVTVDPKGSAPGYEIIVGGGEHEFSEGRNPTRGAVGQRVWNVFRF